MNDQSKGTMSVRIKAETRTLIDMLILDHRIRTQENLTIDEAIRLLFDNSRPDIVSELERKTQEASTPSKKSK